MIILGRKSMCNIDGINPDYLKRVVINEGGETKWAIKDRNRQCTPYFTNEFKCYKYNDRSFMFVGEVDGRRDIYCVVGYKGKDENFFFKADTNGDVNHIEPLDDEERLFIVKTGRGSYLFDSLLFERKSDLFDSLFPLGKNLVFRKDLLHNDKVYSFYGEVRQNGTFRRNIIYGDEDIGFLTPKCKDPKGNFEIIDEFKLEEEIEDLERKRGVNLKKKLKTLFKLNLDSDEDL